MYIARNPFVQKDINGYIQTVILSRTSSEKCTLDTDETGLSHKGSRGQSPLENPQYWTCISLV